VAEVERSGVEALLQRAAAAHPTCTLALLIDGLHHYLQQRERSEFRCPRLLMAALHCWARRRHACGVLLPCCCYEHARLVVKMSVGSDRIA
jgi:hypothetical protein